MKHRQICLLATLFATALLGACGRSPNQNQNPNPSTASGAVAEQDQRRDRPGAALGIFVSVHLGRPNVGQGKSALLGVIAQLQLHREFNPATANDTYVLLQEFGNILQVNVMEILNLSADRPTTLNEYTDALRNVTDRSRERVTDLEAAEEALRRKISDERRIESTLDRQRREAEKAGDYGTVGAMQQELSQAEVRQSQVEATHKQTRDTRRTFEDLIEISDRRLNAIERNREILIAGLSVENVPGAEDLGIVDDSNDRRVLDSIFDVNF